MSDDCQPGRVSGAIASDGTYAVIRAVDGSRTLVFLGEGVTALKMPPAQFKRFVGEMLQEFFETEIKANGST